VDTVNRVLNGDQLGAAIILADILGVETRISTPLGDIDIAALTQGGLLGLGIERGNTVFWLTDITPMKQVVDADFPTATWTSASDQSLSEPIYAGDGNGDMVSWRLGSVPGATYAWSANGPETIVGPSGLGVNEWKIADGDSDPTDRLSWRPGSYTIKCKLTYSSGATRTIRYDQMVGWRTDEYVIVGQVKPLNDVQLTAEQALTLKSNIVTDVSSSTFWAGSLFSPPLELSTLAWFGAQAFVTNGYSDLRIANLPDVGDTERLWMLQHILNSNPDLFNVPDSFEPGVLLQLTQEESHRMYSRIRYKYILSANGTIKQAIAAPTSANLNGPTKVTLPTDAVTAFNWITNASGLPLLQLPAQILIPSEVATTSGFYFDKQGGRLSSFVSGRIGIEGQYPNYALFRRNAPYIFAETIFGLDSSRKATQQTIRLSVDKTWLRNGGETGAWFFNEIRIFRRNYSQSGAPFEIVRTLAFSENPGMLREFIFSLPLLTFPGTEPQPTVTNTP